MKKNEQAMAALLLGVIVLAALQSGYLVWTEPVHVLMMVPNTDGTGTTQKQVANTWQEWTVRMKDGTAQVKTSGKRGIIGTWGLPLDLVSGSSVPLYVEVTVPIEFTIQLPKGANLPFTSVPSWYAAFLVRETIHVYLNGQDVGVAYATNYPDLVLTYTSFDSPHKVVNFKFPILLSGSWPSAVEAGILMPLDLRTRIASLPRNQPFNLGVDVYQSWDLGKYCDPGGKVCGNFGHQDETLQYTVGFQITMSSFTVPFTATLPTQTIGGTVTTSSGVVVVVVTQIVPSISTVATGPGVTATIMGNGTTIVTTMTEPGGGTLKCSTFLPDWLCGTFDPFAWLKGSTYGIPNWLILLGIIIVVLWILSRLLRPQVNLRAA